MTRKTITIQEPVYRKLDAESAEDESFGETIERLIDQSGSEHTSNTPDQLTTDHIDDIAAATSTQTVRELENLLTGR